MAQKSLAVTVLNTVRAGASTLYQERIPEATIENIASIGRSFKTYVQEFNYFANELMHRIGMSIFSTNSFQNKLAPFKSGEITDMQDIEEIFVDQFRVAEGTYDKDGGMGEGGIHPFKRREYQDTKVMYHRMNRQDKYVISIGKVDLLRAFRSESTLSKWLTAQFNSLTTGSNYDEWIHMKELFAEGIKAGDFFTYETEALDGTQAKALSLVRTIKKAVKDISYVSTDFNPMGLKQQTEKKDVVLFINKDIATHLDVDCYSLIFGPDYAKLNITIIELDDFGSDATGTDALLVDKDWFKVYDNLHLLEDLKNPEGLYTNYWLHVWQTLSYSKFKTAVRFGRKITA